MKNIAGQIVPVLFVLLIFYPAAFCASYYVDAVSGNDANNGLSAESAWKTLDKVNAAGFREGDNIFFKRGQAFYGSLRPSVSGVSYGAYGSGSKPVITGIALLTGWVSSGNGVYETTCSSCDAALTLLAVNDTVKAMGRYPNASAPNGGYLTIAGHSGNTLITDPGLAASANWTGAELVIKKNSWTLDRAIVTNQSGHTLTYASLYGGGFDSQDGYGYFFQNSPLTLDQFGEWYYEPSVKKVKILMGNNNPSQYNIKVGTVDTLVYLDRNDNINFTDLSFEGSAAATFRIQNAVNISLQHCDIAYSGFYAIKDSNCVNLVINGCSINKTNNSAIEGYACTHAVITNNTIRNTGMLAGMGGRNDQPYKGIVTFGTGNLIAGNRIDSTGYMGIFFYGDSAVVRNNYVNYFATVLDDGGGIYTFGGYNNYGRVISNNIVLNGIGAPAGTTSTAGGACGIYTDDRSANVEIDSNTVASCVRAGLFLHNSHEAGINGNTFFDNGTQVLMAHDAGFPADTIRNLVITRNILFSKLAGQFVSWCSGVSDDFNRYGYFDSNYYSRPFDTAGIIATAYSENNHTEYSYYDLKGWGAAYKMDLHSLTGPRVVPYTIENATSGNIFTNGSFNSGVNGTFCLSSPGSCSVTWSSDGHLDGGAAHVSYNTTGGANASMGVYFNLGAVEANKDYIIRFSLTGNNQLNKTFELFLLRGSQPVANHSPSRFYALTGARTENEYLYHSQAGETVMLAFVFTKTDTSFWVDNVQMRTVKATVTNPDDSIKLVYNKERTASTITLDGNYRDVKDNFYLSKIRLRSFGAAVLIKVPGAFVISNQPPVADAGVDTVVSLTAVSLVLDGSASFDPEGSNMAYSWKQTAGPAQAILANIHGVTTPVSVLQEGVYVFELTVTDDRGLSGKATVYVTVKNNYNNSAYFKLYPNPANSILNFQLVDDTRGNVGMRLLDAGGKTISNGLYFKGQSLLKDRINVGNISAGLYYLQLMHANGSKMVKPFLKL